jgi:L-ascorbate metabolism protein UlaG (beta-lactamase superfamily)
MAASGLRRYPREIVASIREAGAAATLREHSARRVPAAFHDADLAAVWLGHASVLLRVGGLTILTDPVFSDRVGMRIGSVTVGMPRLQPLPLSEDLLPPIDLILLSHAHFDHLDKPTLRRLVSPTTTVITARRTARLIPRGFGAVIEMDWDTGFTVETGAGRKRPGRPADGSSGEGGGLHISAHRPRHYGARFAYDRRRGFNAYLIERPSGYSRRRTVFFAGDTAVTDAFNGLGPVDLAIFGIGAYGHWGHAHANPEEAWSMFQRMNRAAPGRGVMLPMHHSTFPLGGEPVDEPMQRLLAAAGPREADRVVGRRAGELWAA